MADRKRTWWLSSNGLLLTASPVAMLRNVASHAGHFDLVYVHMLGGTIMLSCGAINLYIGATRRLFRHHRLVGRTYLVGGTVAAVKAYRAVRNRRYDSHRDWMIRSYVLAWSFVFCRIVSRVPAVGELGDGQVFIRLSWIGPVLLCEAALPWRAGSRQPV